MAVPGDFATTLAKIQEYGILAEPPDQIRERLVLALQGVAAIEAGQTVDLGVVDWASRLVHDFEVAIHKEICDANKGELKEAYQGLLAKALTPEGVSAVASVVLKVAYNINPAFAVSSVGIYLALWLLKVGLNHWCAQKIAS